MRASGREHSEHSQSDRVDFHRPVLPRRPLVPLCLAAILGIILDRVLGLPMPSWLGTSFVAIAGSIVCHRSGRRRAAAALLWLTGLAVVGAWHHQRTAVFSVDDIGNFISSTPQLCRVQGRVSTEPIISHQEPSPLSWDTRESTSFILEVTALKEPLGLRSAKGRLYVHVQGKIESIGRGDRVEIFGWLNRPALPSSQGEFDFRGYLLDRRVQAELYVEDPGAAELLKSSRYWSLGGWRDDLRDAASRYLRQSLPPEQSALAEAILLGRRTSMTREELVPFFESGTMHLLVVSGLHLALPLGFLWLLFLFLFRWGSLRWCAVILITLAAVYTYFTGGYPPVVRACILVGFYLGTFVIWRPASSINSLAGAALVILALDPTNLFRGGPQLSFAAVLGIILFFPPLSQYIHRWRQRRWLSQGYGLVEISWWMRYRVEGFLISLVFFLATAPLIVYHFHLFTPISVVLSPFLLPLLIIALWTGMLSLIAAAFLPWVAFLLVTVCGWSLWVMSAIVEWANNSRIGSYYTPSPPGWWVLGFYVCLFLPWFWSKFRIREHFAMSQMFGGDTVQLPAQRFRDLEDSRSHHRMFRIYLLGNLIWLAVGFTTLWSRPPETLEYHQLAVGHGNCAVFRFPTGETIIHDCGSLRGPAVTERVIAPWLWSQGLGAVDAVFLSHADIDHYNGIVKLAERFSIGAVYVPPQFAASKEPGVEFLFHQLSELGVPIRLIWRDDEITIGQVTLNVLHPGPNEVHKTDNSASLVLECRWQESFLLCTGDLSDDGLARMLDQPSRSVDVLIAPHHGSRSSNTTELARWAQPELVLSTQGYRPPPSPLEVYSEMGAKVLRTDQDGTISLRFRSDFIEVDTFRTGKELRLRTY